MLQKIASPKSLQPPVGGRFAIVASEYNARYVDGMLRSAGALLKRLEVARVQVIRVPGAFEIPVVAGALVRTQSAQWDAVICLGVILRGATTHAQSISAAVSFELARLQSEYGIPLIHEVLLLESATQARERCLNQDCNRGEEAALTAVRMARVMKELQRNGGTVRHG